MLKHVVLLKFKDNILIKIDELDEMISLLPKQIRQNIACNGGRNILRLERSFDYAIVADFNNIEDLNRYQNHTEHNKIKNFLKPLCSKIISVDFEI